MNVKATAMILLIRISRVAEFGYARLTDIPWIYEVYTPRAVHVSFFRQQSHSKTRTPLLANRLIRFGGLNTPFETVTS